MMMFFAMKFKIKNYSVQTTAGNVVNGVEQGLPYGKLSAEADGY